MPGKCLFVSVQFESVEEVNLFNYVSMKRHLDCVQQGLVDGLSHIVGWFYFILWQIDGELLMEH